MDETKETKVVIDKSIEIGDDGYVNVTTFSDGTASLYYNGGFWYGDFNIRFTEEDWKKFVDFIKEN